VSVPCLRSLRSRAEPAVEPHPEPGASNGAKQASTLWLPQGRDGRSCRLTIRKDRSYCLSRSLEEPLFLGVLRMYGCGSRGRRRAAWLCGRLGDPES
jgi:hypothetical protein